MNRCFGVLTLGLALPCCIGELPQVAGETEKTAQEAERKPGPEAEPPIDLEGLLAVLEASAGEAQWTTMQKFAAQTDAPAAISRLFEEMRKSAPQLDNNVGLMIELILHRHPDAPCPMEPLLEGIHRKIWNSQQKCAQALCLLLERGDGKGREKELCASLIPLLASQRPRVFNAAERCLEALTGQDLGNVPDRWLKWFEMQFGTAVDMTDAIYEDLVVIESQLDGDGEDSTPVYHVEGEEIPYPDALEDVLEYRVQEAESNGLRVGVSIQISNERMDSLAFEPDKLFGSKDIQAAMAAARSQGITDIVVSPKSDAFRAPWRAKY